MTKAIQLADVCNDIFGGEEKRRDVIIFCDPGKDDAAMLAQILSSPDINVVGIIPSAGNAPLENAVQNTLNLLSVLGREDVPVYPGARSPIGKKTHEMENAAGAHGLTGFGEVEVPTSDLQARKEDGVDFAARYIEALGNKSVTLVSTGGLTDVYHTLDRVAKGYRGDKDLLKIDGIFMMAGVLDKKQANAPVAKEGDNLAEKFARQYAEFNAIFDPRATQGVFDIARRENIPVILAPLDLTHRVLLSETHAAALNALGNPVADLLAKFVRDVGDWDVERFPKAKSPDGTQQVPVHDACTSSALLHPELFQGRWVHVTASGNGNQIGATREMPWNNVTRPNEANVFVLELPPQNLEKFHAAYRDDIARYGNVEREPEYVPQDRTQALPSSPYLRRRDVPGNTGRGA